VSSGRDVLEYLMAGAHAVQAGTIHFAEPRAGTRIVRELRAEMTRLEIESVDALVGSVRPW
jgi:dihydroorotate dehydrogenase (NAD+) catalytic subunit